MRPTRYLTWLFGLLGVLWLVVAAVVPGPDVRVQIIRALLGLGLHAEAAPLYWELLVHRFVLPD
jgi:hypothetical protein